MNSNLASSGNSSYMYRTTFSLVHSHFIKNLSVFGAWYLELGIWSYSKFRVSPHIPGNLIAAAKYQVPTTSHRIGANALRNFCVARNSVFLAVSSVVFS